MFSPRAWGWSVVNDQRGAGVNVLPTCVGMVRIATTPLLQSHRSPHVRGDGPDARTLTSPSRTFSPRAWGWSVVLFPGSGTAGVLPTCVGMVRIDEAEE